MKTRLYISILFCLLAMNTWAQTYKNTYTPKNTKQQEVGAIQSQQIMQTSVHAGTIYEPFSNAAPSEQSFVGAAQPTSNGPHRARKDFDVGGETGQSTESPVGNTPWLLMLLLGAGYFSVKVIRKKSH
jgi:hypothetical protein